MDFNRRLTLVLAILITWLSIASDRCWAQNEAGHYLFQDEAPSSAAPSLDALHGDSAHGSLREQCSGSSWHGDHREPGFKLTEFNIYPTFSFLDDQVGNYCEFEFASKTQLGRFEMENRTVMNVADLPGTIQLGPANPDLGRPIQDIRGNGFGDILSGFFFSRRARKKKSHFGIGPVVTLPTASNELLGSDQWTIGPGAHYSTEIGRLSTGFFIWQSWGLTDGTSKKAVNQLFGKPFFIYSVSKKWNLIYIPMGLSHSWKSPQGDDWTVPIGGGVRRLFEMHGKKMGLQFQAFDYVARKPTDPQWELRCTIEFLFD